MAAIAYVTDEKMIEYHRVNGSNSIVFWRLSTKKFSDFNIGDLLFFLSKDTTTKTRKEKGLVGYGRFVGSSSMAISTMWRKHRTKTGYISKKELYGAIEKSKKTKKMPEKINCLVLDRVVFFRNPIYLSDLGYKIPKNLESFTYLDKHEGQQTLRILEEAQKIGLDLWSSIQGAADETSFNQQLTQYKIATIIEALGIEDEITKKYYKKIEKKYSIDNYLWINNRHIGFINFGKPNILYYLFQSNIRDIKENYYKMVGQLVSLLLNVEQSIEEVVKIVVVSNRILSDSQIETLNKIGISYLYEKE
ncbi:MAG: hypothetical protein QM204_04485 [Bacillota bacterium]|jgi:hypothetical protein|nr:hypothetical protein [Bacillota bacterium]NLL26454.1 hypothetical protein [Erysipelotrichia bacterium]